MIRYNIDVGFCLYSLSTLIFFVVLKIFVAFRCYRLEARWWHGDDSFSEAEILCLASPGCGRLMKVVIIVFHTVMEKLGLEGRVPSSVQQTSSEIKLSIASPLAGLQLSGISAAMVASEVDNFDSRTSRPSKRVPLIDFNKVRIFPDRMIGQGSTAKVYEGKWGKRKCAVKVLFGVEITAEDISRTCYEAQLLHSLTNKGFRPRTSTATRASVSVAEEGVAVCDDGEKESKKSLNVVGMYGIAVIPPSLCVILELCSEGSLYQVVHDVNLPTTPASSNHGARTISSSMFAPRGLSLTANTDKPTRTHDGYYADNSSPFKYHLCWFEKLEIAYGAIKGVCEVHSNLPRGYSHNDIKSGNFLVQKVIRQDGRRTQDNLNDDGDESDDSCCCGVLRKRSRRRKETVQGSVKMVSSLLINKSLKYKYEVKIADIEFASQNISPQHMLFSDEKPVEKEVVNWTAPEVLSGESPVSQSSDVFALSLVLYEIYNRQIPFTGVPSNQIAARYISGERPSFTDDDVWQSEVRRVFQVHEDLQVEHRTSSSSIVVSASDVFIDKEDDGVQSKKYSQLLAIESESRGRFRSLVGRGWAQAPEDRLTASEMLIEMDAIKNDYYRQLKQCEDSKLAHRLSKFNSLSSL